MYVEIFYIILFWQWQTFLGSKEHTYFKNKQELQMRSQEIINNADFKKISEKKIVIWKINNAK